MKGQLAMTAGDSTGGKGGMVEGWLLAATTKRGAMMQEASDALAAQVAFEKQVILRRCCVLSCA